LSNESTEVILAQEQGATLRGAGAKKELEAEFGIDEVEGTLVLTNKRLIFVGTDEKEEDLPGEMGINPMGKIHLVFSEVEDIEQIPERAPNVFILIASISSVKGRGGGFERPSLEVEWNDGRQEHAVVLTVGMMGGKGKNLKDWAPIIENLKAGRQKLIAVPVPPSVDTLQGKIVRVLSDMQEKGVLEIEEAVETEFKVDLDPDEVQAACDALASQGLLKRYPDSSGDVFYRRTSPLGEEDLAS
jgi:hypothetical protein